MKKIVLAWLSLFALPCLLIAQNQTHSPLEGTWKLVKSQWGDMKKLKAPKREIYKIFTKEHFYFVYYDDKKCAGAGGGSYTTDAQTFTETLDYYSWDSTAVGTQQTFNWTINGNTLHQSGFIKGTDEYDDYVIEEYYERVASPDTDNGLLGVWQIEKSTYGTSTKTAAESELTIRKIFTPTHWYATYYNRNTGSFSGVGFGTYLLEGDQYHETIHAFSWDQSAVGQTVTFTMDVQPQTLTQNGKINTDQYKDYTILEHFKRIE